MVGASPATTAALAGQQVIHPVVSTFNALSDINTLTSKLGLCSSEAYALASTYEGNADLIAYLEGKPLQSNDIDFPRVLHSPIDSWQRMDRSTCQWYRSRWELVGLCLEVMPLTEFNHHDGSEAVWQTPSCTIFASNEKAVATSLLIIGFLEVRFSVRSGGHSPNPGW